MLQDLNEMAGERKREIETVRVSAVIPPAIAATVNLAKLSTAKRVLLTIKVVEFDLRAPIPEIDYPPCIGSLSGEVVAIAKSMLKK